jgi:hypothetical protein
MGDTHSLSSTEGGQVRTLSKGEKIRGTHKLPSTHRGGDKSAAISAEHHKKARMKGALTPF